MAISRGAGTEIIRSVNLEAVNSTGRNLIYGEQHHIYTVLSVIAYADNLNAAGDYITMRLIGYDAVVGETAQHIQIFKEDMQVLKTFVWNDKFSFNGHEPTDFTGPLDSIVKQDAVADQGSSVAQLLVISSEHASDNFDVICTYIDQNNS